MNKYQWTALAVAAINVVAILLFPPYDYLPATRASPPAFDGFHFAFGPPGPRQVNYGFLQLEVIVVLLNAAIAWLLLRDRKRTDEPRPGMDWQKVVLVGIALNLLLVVLFPPMQSRLVASRAALPSFDGFYFLFGDAGRRIIVTELLYVEVVFILVNGAILWLLFRRARGDELDKRSAAMLRMKV